MEYSFVSAFPLSHYNIESNSISEYATHIIHPQYLFCWFLVKYLQSDDETYLKGYLELREIVIAAEPEMALTAKKYGDRNLSLQMQAKHSIQQRKINDLGFVSYTPKKFSIPITNRDGTPINADKGTNPNANFEPSKSRLWNVDGGKIDTPYSFI